VAARDFLAMGMLLSILDVMRVIGPDAVPAEPWMTGMLASLGLQKPCLSARSDSCVDLQGIGLALAANERPP